MRMIHVVPFIATWCRKLENNGIVYKDKTCMIWTGADGMVGKVMYVEDRPWSVKDRATNVGIKTTIVQPHT